MAKFIKRQVIIDAWRFQVDEKHPPKPGVRFLHWPILVDSIGYHLLIQTLESQTFRVDNGDWVIKGIKGEHYACKNDIFQLSYDTLNAGEVYGGEERRKRLRAVKA